MTPPDIRIVITCLIIALMGVLAAPMLQAGEPTRLPGGPIESMTRIKSDIVGALRQRHQDKEVRLKTWKMAGNAVEKLDHMQFAGLEVDGDIRKFKAYFQDPTGAQASARGYYEVVVPLPSIKHRMRNGQIIQESDLTTIYIDEQDIRRDTIHDPEELIGKTPRHSISQERHIRRVDIEEPALIEKGSQITLLYESGPIELRTRGEARNDGALGATIEVENQSSGKRLMGRIEGPGLVRIMPTIAALRTGRLER